jgi:hypothetical protein
VDILKERLKIDFKPEDQLTIVRLMASDAIRQKAVGNISRTPTLA